MYEVFMRLLPAMFAIASIGLLLTGIGFSGYLKLLTSKRNFGIALSLCFAQWMLPSLAKAQATVSLAVVTSPAMVSAGSSTLSVVGFGFPSGAISPANVLLSLSTTCGGSATTMIASTVTSLSSSSDEIGFVIPASVSPGTYFVSISGISGGASFTSGSSCALVKVLQGTPPKLTINTTNPVDWVISNGALTIDYNSQSGAIWSVVPTGTQDQLVDFGPGNAVIAGSTTPYDPADGESSLGGTPLPSGWAGPSGIPNLPPSFANVEPKGFYMDLAGFGQVTPTPNYSLTSEYLDWWTTFPSSSTGTVNAFTYEEHFVVTPNDTGIHIYFVANHAATDPTGSMGQVQWIFRDNTNEFTSLYNVNADLSMSSPVITPLPSPDDCFSSDNGRNDEDTTGRDTIDLYPQLGVTNSFSPYPAGQIPQGFHRMFCVKYDYSSYEYLHPAHGVFGSNYGLWVVFSGGHDTFVGGPGKQNLDFTGGILTMEALSGHYETGGITVGNQGTAGSTQTKNGSVLTNRLFGPFYVRINKFGGNIQTPGDMYNDALIAGASFTRFYNNEATLLSRGYVPTTARGSVSVQVSGIAGGPKTAWAVLSQPGVNHQQSTVGYQYVADISSNGSATFTNVVPGTYRLSVFDFGQFGEYRNDNVVVTGNQITAVPPINFVPENFGEQVWTIGTPDRSSHEFLHGHNAVNYPDQPLGFDDREYYGAWNYWADFASTNGAVIYNATDGPNGPATNNPLKWNYAHWGGFNPGRYGGAFVSSDDSTDGYKYLIPSYVAGLPNHSGTNGTTTPTPPWQVHFATPADAASYSSGYVVLTLALSASQTRETVSLNGNPLAYTPLSAYNSDAIERSGLSGFYQWVAFQWPASDLAAVGADNVLTTSVSGTNSQDSDDALRLELTNNSANPTLTGWNDYTFVTSGTTTPANDAVPNP
jgi:rhamnogalacturonan endolyase